MLLNIISSFFWDFIIFTDGSEQVNRAIFKYQAVQWNATANKNLNQELSDSVNKTLAFTKLASYCAGVILFSL